MFGQSISLSSEAFGAGVGVGWSEGERGRGELPFVWRAVQDGECLRNLDLQGHSADVTDHVATTAVFSRSLFCCAAVLFLRPSHYAVCVFCFIQLACALLITLLIRWSVLFASVRSFSIDVIMLKSIFVIVLMRCFLGRCYCVVCLCYAITSCFGVVC